MRLLGHQTARSESGPLCVQLGGLFQRCGVLCERCAGESVPMVWLQEVGGGYGAGNHCQSLYKFSTVEQNNMHDYTRSFITCENLVVSGDGLTRCTRAALHYFHTSCTAAKLIPQCAAMNRLSAPLA